MSLFHKNRITEHPCGALISPVDSRDYYIVPTATDLPDAYTIDDGNVALPVVKNQGNVGSCVAHAMSSILEYFYTKETGKSIVSSTDFIYGMKDILLGQQADYEGMYLRDACRAVQKFGNVSLTFCDTNTKTSDGAGKIAEKLLDNHSALADMVNYRVDSYFRCDTVFAIKSALHCGSPVLACMNWYASYYLKTNKSIHFTSTKCVGSHAIMIYGWNKVGFLAQNSWGNSFGFNGRFIIPYASVEGNEYRIQEAWAFKDSKNDIIRYDIPTLDITFVDSDSYTNSDMVDYVEQSPNFNDRLGFPIRKLTIHHVAGITDVESLGHLFANPARQASSNYGIGNDGRVGMYVPERYRAWTSGSWSNDVQAITIEVSNDVMGEPWSISEKAYNTLIKLCVDVCQRNNIKEINFTGDATGNLTMHKYFQYTGCPGTYLSEKYPEIAETINTILKGEEPMTKEEKAEFEVLQHKVDVLEEQNGAIYDTIEQMPDWAKPTIQKLVDKGILKGDENGQLDLSYQTIRIYVILDRQGLFD